MTSRLRSAIATSYIAAGAAEGFNVSDLEEFIESLCKTGVVLALIVWALVIFFAIT